MTTARPVAVLVEDEPQIRRFVRSALESAGWQVFESDSVKQGLVEASTRQPGLVIVDLGLPDGDGIELRHELRGWSNVPIVVLSARNEEGAAVAAVDAGADDFLTKPFGVSELPARVCPNLRRHHQAAGGTADAAFCFGDVEVDHARRVVRDFPA